jgi:hypothetical protein
MQEASRKTENALTPSANFLATKYEVYQNLQVVHSKLYNFPSPSKIDLNPLQAKCSFHTP